MSQSNLAESKKYYTVEEYLAFERESEEKHEYIDGEIIAMAGASREHNLIGTNTGTEIRFRLKGKQYETYISDMRVRVKSNRYCYPDVVAVCGEPEFAKDDDFDILLNPTVVVEVLSPSTKFRDKTKKLEDYRKIDSLRECLLIEQDKMFVEHFIKQTPSQWLLRIYENAGDTVKLESIGCEILLSDIYLQVEFKTVLQ
ncbi:MAG: Uma2 family endonuclease [Pyrinomonadaceae bacterium]|nr:Uma2 family endonuclease [Pyrinomonadaceae bacterium]